MKTALQAALRPAAALVLLAALLQPAAARAQSVPKDALDTLNAAARDLKDLEITFESGSEGRSRDRLRERAAAVGRTATAEVVELAPLQGLLEARAVQLGTPAPGVVEAPEIQAERRALSARRSVLDSAIRRGNLIALEARQLAERVKAREAQAFSRSLLARGDSPLLWSFWTAAGAAEPADTQRARGFLQAEVASVRDHLGSSAALWLFVGVLAAVALVVPVRIGLERLGQRLMIKHAPNTRLRRSGLAFWLAATGMFAPVFASAIFVDRARAAGMIAPRWESLSDIFLGAVLLAGAVAAMGESLLQNRLPSWRLLPLSSEVADGLRPWSWVLAVAAFASLMITALHNAVGASGPTSDVTDLALAVAHLGVTAAVLFATRRVHLMDLDRLRRAGEDIPPESPAVSAVVLATAAVVLSATVLLLSGYVALALLLTRLLTWLPLIAAALYLLLLFVDDACTALFAPASFTGRALTGGLRMRASLVVQAGVVLSAVLRVLLLLTAVGVAFVPFGSHLDSLIEEVRRLSDGVTFGQVTLKPAAVLRALAVLAGGLLVVRAAQHWLDERYLPATELDAGARNSVSTSARYAGLILTGLWALASLGVGIERIALLLSALSVGIGFGLQAITQNFVSGLILLAERPVRIGDLIRLGEHEGDVKRIRVRSTEIEMSDGATLVVPNSELITKSLLNKTHADPTGRIQIRFSVGLDSNVARLREIVSTILAAHESVLQKPAPKVFFDEVADGSVQLNCLAYVGSPRDVYSNRSELIYQVIVGLQAEGIELAPSKRTQDNAALTAAIENIRAR